MPTIEVFENAHAVAEATARSTVESLKAAITTYGEAVWVLAGGTIPPKAAALIVSAHADGLDWSKVVFLIGDERCVPLDDIDSSWSAYQQSFSRLPGIHSSHLLRPHSDRSAEEAAELYESTLKSLAKNSAGYQRLDLIWLGMGDDGHTLSLFPDHDSSLPHDRLVIPVHNSPKPPPDRISFTFEALAGAATCMIIASGAGKANVVKRSLEGDVSLPIAKAAAIIETSGGKVTWLLDANAASLIRS